MPGDDDYNLAYQWMSSFDTRTSVVERERFAKNYATHSGDLTPAQFYSVDKGIDFKEFLSEGLDSLHADRRREDPDHRIQPLKQDLMSAPHVRTDRNVAASYVTLSDNAVVKSEQAHRNVLIDVDAEGELVGIEIFGTVFIDLMDEIAGERVRRPIDGRAPEAY